MRVAVLTLTRDRLEYTQRCFAALREHAGCEYDHIVWDNGSTDGTMEWLKENDYVVGSLGRNVGIHAGMNSMLSYMSEGDYDVVVKMDNDCEIVTPGTLKAVAELHDRFPETLVGPTVQGLRSPPPRGGGYEYVITDYPNDIHRVYRVAETPQIGGILMPIPKGWRYDETQPFWGMDDCTLSARTRARGGIVGQLVDYHVNHIETTDGQHARYPEYFARRVAEGGPE